MMWDELLKAIISVAVILITGFVVPWLKAKLDESKFDKFQKIVNRAVLAAQQLYGDADGEDKKEYVLRFLSGIRGSFSSDEINIYLEAAVKDMKVGGSDVSG